MKRIAVIVSQPSESQTLIISVLDEVAVQYQKFSCKEIPQLHVENFDALLFPERILGTVEIVQAIKDFHANSKPIAAFGLSVILISQILGHLGITLGVCSDNDVLTDIGHTGAYPEVCAADDFVTDRENKIISATGDLAGVQRAIRELLEMA